MLSESILTSICFRSSHTGEHVYDDEYRPLLPEFKRLIELNSRLFSKPIKVTMLPMIDPEYDMFDVVGTTHNYKNSPRFRFKVENFINYSYWVKTDDDKVYHQEFPSQSTDYYRVKAVFLKQLNRRINRDLDMIHVGRYQTNEKRMRKCSIRKFYQNLRVNVTITDHVHNLLSDTGKNTDYDDDFKPRFAVYKESFIIMVNFDAIKPEPTHENIGERDWYNHLTYSRFYHLNAYIKPLQVITSRAITRTFNALAADFEQCGQQINLDIDDVVDRRTQLLSLITPSDHISPSKRRSKKYHDETVFPFPSTFRFFRSLEPVLEFVQTGRIQIQEQRHAQYENERQHHEDW